MLLLLLCHEVPLEIDMSPVVKGRYARDALPRDCFSEQWLVESPKNGASDRHEKCGDTRSPSWHTGLLDAEHM